VGPLAQRIMAGELSKSPSTMNPCLLVRGVEDGLPHDVLHYPRASS
jgi:hypothetical protein